MATTPHLGATLLEMGQAQKEVTVNMALTRLDALMNTGAISQALTTPPASPASGDVYIVAASGAGEWAGKDGQIAYFDQIWRFITPREGVSVWVNNEDAQYVYDGAAWQAAGRRVISPLAVSGYTVSINDIGKTLDIQHASAITLTLPNSLPQGFHCQVVQRGTGQIQFVAASGAVLRQRQSHTRTAGQYALCRLDITENGGGNSAVYLLSGDTSA